jgi:hypothetical protein
MSYTNFKATELSCVKIAITFVSSFISFLERCIKESVQLEIAKKKILNSRGEKK